jgi:hypothetical protein
VRFQGAPPPKEKTVREVVIVDGVGVLAGLKPSFKPDEVVTLTHGMRRRGVALGVATSVSQRCASRSARESRL